MCTPYKSNSIIGIRIEVDKFKELLYNYHKDHIYPVGSKFCPECGKPTSVPYVSFVYNGKQYKHSEAMFKDFVRDKFFDNYEVNVLFHKDFTYVYIGIVSTSCYPMDNFVELKSLNLDAFKIFLYSMIPQNIWDKEIDCQFGLYSVSNES